MDPRKPQIQPGRNGFKNNARQPQQAPSKNNTEILLDYKYPGNLRLAYPNITETLDKVIEIVNVEWMDTNKGRIYYVYTRNGNYYTWSKILGKQLEEIKKIIEDYKEKGVKAIVRGRIIKIKNYLVLISP